MKQSVLDAPNSPSKPFPSERRSRGIVHFVIALAVIIVLRILVGFVPVPESSLKAVSLVVSVLFIAVPIIGFYRGADFPWTMKGSLSLIALGAATQFLFGFAQSEVAIPLLKGILLAISQTGLLLWTFGIGASLALFLKDKNLLLPMAIFLALFDIWLVYAPEGVANQAISGSRPQVQQLFQQFSFQVPAPVKESAGGLAQPLAYVGPADWLFLAMFFVALYRFKMRTKATFYAMIPTLAAYLLIVLLFRDVVLGPFRLGAMPALVPIGIVILLVNWREFKLTRDEKLSTAVVLLLGIAVVSWRLVVSHNALEQQVEPSQEAPAPERPRRTDLPPPV